MQIGWNLDEKILLDVPIDPNEFKILLFTSGTTGKPKGVLIEHSGISRLIDNIKCDFGMCSDDVILLFASFSFDASVGVYIAATMAGTRVVLLEPSKTSDPVAIKEIVEMAKDKVTAAVAAAITVVVMLPELLHLPLLLNKLLPLILL